MKRKICLEIATIGKQYCSVKCLYYSWDRRTMACPWCSLFEFCLQTTDNNKAKRVQQCLNISVGKNKYKIGDKVRFYFGGNGKPRTSKIVQSKYDNVWNVMLYKVKYDSHFKCSMWYREWELSSVV